MRRFFLRDKELTSCGIGEGSKGWKYFCATCGENWGTIQGMEQDKWFIITYPCEAHGRPYTPGGSFLRPLVWWDVRNGGTLEKQLNSANEELLQHEALMAANWILTTKG